MTSTVVISGRLRAVIEQALNRLGQDVDQVSAKVEAAMGHGFPQPDAVARLTVGLNGLRQQLKPGQLVEADVAITSQYLSILKTAISRERRKVAQDVSERKRRTSQPAMLADLEKRLAPFNQLAECDWYRTAPALRVPGPRDLLTVQYLDEGPLGPSLDIPKIDFDSKAGILRSARQLMLDLARQRTECEARGVTLAVVFLDVDDFKAFNTDYTEPIVDRDVLPVLMRSLATSFFGHGECYRHGGDEFVALLPNSQGSILLPILEAAQKALKEAEYASGIRRPTVSIGACEVQPLAAVTDEEILSIAAFAKATAKAGGKDKISRVQVVDTEAARID